VWLFAIAAALCAAWLFEIVRGARAAAAMPRLVPEGPRPGERFPRLSIIVAARDEERSIGTVVDSLLAQSYPDFEVVVVDDRSLDATPRLLAERLPSHPKLEVIRVHDLPAGWVGKSHANALGAGAARGDVFLFTDGDVVHHPDAAATAVRELLRRDVELLSPLPRIERGMLLESVVLPVFAALITARFPAHHVNDPRKATALAAGGFLVLRRRAYEAVGGHAAIRGEMIDDVSLALRVKSAGFGIAVVDGSRLSSTRMYESLSDLWEGMTKSAYAAVGRKVGLALLAAAFIFVLGLGAIVTLAVAAATRNELATGVAAGAVGLQILYHLGVQRALGQAFAFAFASPLGYAFYATGLLASALRVRFGAGVTWKGTRYR
jgi:chlorobactene glucosyltransferase